MRSLLRLKLLCLSFLFTTACVDNRPSVDVQVSELVVDSSAYSFGEEIELGATVADKVFTISKGVNPANTSFVLSSTDFSVVSATGCNRILKKNTEKCYLKVRFLKSKTAGTYQANLIVGEGEEVLDISLSATVVAPIEPPGVLSVLEGTTTVTSLDFGLLNKNASVQKMLTIKNIGTKETVVGQSLSGSSNFTIISNNCSSLKANKTCQIRILAKAPATAPEEDEVIESSLSVTNLTIPMQATLNAEEIIVGSPLIKAYEGSVEVTESAFGVLATSAVSKTFTLKNEGNAAQVGTATLTGDAAFVLTSNNCTALKNGKTCFVRVTFNTLSQTPGAKAAVLTYGALEVPMTGTISSLEPESPTALLKIFDGTTEVASNLNLGTSSLTKNLTLKNVGAEVANLDSFTVDFVGSEKISLVKNCPATLSFGQSCPVNLVYTRGDGKTAQGTLRVLDTNFISVKAGTGGIYDSCEAAQLDGQSTDGTISVDIDGAGPKEPFPVYCKDMSTTPKNYIFLVLKSSLENSTVNYGEYDCPTPFYCSGQAKTVYDKVRISFPSLDLDVWDDTYFQSNGFNYYQEYNAQYYYYLPFGYSGTCSGVPGSYGTSHLDFRGTPFSFHPSVHWRPGGWAGTMINAMLTPKISISRGKGYCGGSSAWTGEIQHLIRLTVD